MSDVAEIAEGLSERQSKALSRFTDDWQAGPAMPGEMIAAIKPGEATGLIERQFMDGTPPVYSQRGGELQVKLSACWFFRLTPLGLAVRTHLESKNG